MKIPDKDFITVLIAAIVVAIIFADNSAASVTRIMDYILFGIITVALLIIGVHRLFKWFKK
jgi:branched-subunit amino acid transport protein